MRRHVRVDFGEVGLVDELDDEHDLTHRPWFARWAMKPPAAPPMTFRKCDTR